MPLGKRERQMTTQDNQLELLNKIQPSAPKRRFLQSWDPESGILRFGCGDESNAVQVLSDGHLEPTDPERPTKLRTSTVKQFLAGKTVETPLGDVRAILQRYMYFND